MKKSVKVLVVAMITIMAMFSLVGCGGKDANTDVPTYIAATEPTYPPFDTTAEDGKIIGFDMDLLNAIAEDQGFKVEYKAFEFDSIVPAVESGNADIIAAAMNIMPDRAEKVDFTDKYFDSGKVILVKKDNDTIKSAKDLTASMKVAAQIGTTEAEFVQGLKNKGKIASAVVLNQTTEAIIQLQNGDVDAVVMDAPVAKYYEAKFADKIKQVESLIDPAEMAFAVQKGNTELLDKINAGLANMIKNGTYDELIAKWFSAE